ncbi:calcium/sodium antiporter [Roseivirga spongicola]|uniref:Sodium:proton exchanger n=1 Tax=Roseivirga spongicola TaxID=333140 RepID=A0A150X1G9_9BACT|nr:calcium/sodium antiporter [Roseivirga spongicola]KYG72536.1 sodium:proton exchanger [Roseivirga spongicola]WPZ10132.1 calcium/sodium antiporter [Roseivirga spongicola]
MLSQILLILLGFGLLIKGADWLVSGATKLAKKYGISDLAIGLTIVAFGTSAPELIVNAVASYQGHAEIVFGNIIGSNNFNLFVILGIVGIISPIAVQSSTIWKEIPLSFIAAGLLLILANTWLFGSTAEISRLEATALIAIFGAFLFYVFKQMKTDETTSHVQPIGSFKWVWLLILAGLAGLIIGGKLVVDQATLLAQSFGISERVIGLTIVAAGTSLPELVTSVVAAFKRNSDIAIGNVIGSNIFNILLILSISGLIRPIPYDHAFNREIYVLLIGTIFLFTAMFSGGKKKLDRWEAAILLISFIGYSVWLIG